MARTPKSVALGGAIRQARQERGETLRDFAKRMQLDPGMLSRWETGSRSPKPEHVARMLTALGIYDQRYKELMTLAYGTDADQWVAGTQPEQRQQFAAFAACEQVATRIVDVSPLLIPGLLQTSAYTRAILADEDISPSEVSARIAFRNQRKEVLTRPLPVHYTAIICQAALHQDIGGRHVMAEQLRFLLAMGARSNVDLRIVPFERGWHPALEGHFQLIDGANLITSVFVDMRRSTVLLHKEEDIRAYEAAVRKVMSRAAGRAESLRFIGDLAQRMEKRGDLPDQVAKVDP
ncbi:helix-turn-helix domain-containing protein [Actinokineospora soli]|uniref:Helix-turn-helix domain-containing protein n=1 Tax=Actinokineospora soli TaxID=1048753 RepID=A0ABW2TWA9_9PSEU